MSNNRFGGVVPFFGKEHVFDFDGKILSIHLYDGETAQNVFFEHIEEGVYVLGKNKRLPFSHIKGVIYPDNKTVTFSIDPDNYWRNNPLLLNGVCDIYINVIRYTIIENNEPTVKGTRISCSSKHFYKFLDLVPNYIRDLTTNNTDTLAEIKTNYSRVKDLSAKFTIKGIEYQISPNYLITWGKGVFEFVPFLLIESNETMCDEEIENMYDYMTKFLHFLYLRTNIYFDSFVAKTGNKKIEVFERQRDLIQEREDNLKDQLDIGHPIWEDIYTVFGEIINDFYTQGESITRFLYEDKKSRFIFSLPSTSLDCAAFERIYDLVFKDIEIRSEESQLIYNEIHTELQDKISISTNRKKRIYKHLDKIVDTLRLEDKIKVAFERYNACFNEFEKKHIRSKEYSEIASICSKVRNDIDHGNDDLQFDNDTAECLLYLRALIVTMYYSKWGCTDDKVARIIDDVFSIRV